MFVAPDVGFV